MNIHLWDKGNIKLITCFLENGNFLKIFSLCQLSLGVHVSFNDPDLAFSCKSLHFKLRSILYVANVIRWTPARHWKLLRHLGFGLFSFFSVSLLFAFLPQQVYFHPSIPFISSLHEMKILSPPSHFNMLFR